MKSFSQLARLSHPARVLSSVRCLKVGRLEKSKLNLKKPEAFKQAYDLFDADGDGSITPEELISILTPIGETPSDIHLYFGGMATDTITNHKQVVDFLTFLIQHSKLSLISQFFLLFGPSLGPISDILDHFSTLFFC